jgi:hypothetical protein
MSGKRILLHIPARLLAQSIDQIPYASPGAVYRETTWQEVLLHAALLGFEQIRFAREQGLPFPPIPKIKSLPVSPQAPSPSDEDPLETLPDLDPPVPLISDWPPELTPFPGAPLKDFPGLPPIGDLPDIVGDLPDIIGDLP